jgi:hypothetical protein
MRHLLQAKSSLSRAQQTDGDETYFIMKSNGIAVLRKAEIIMIMIMKLVSVKSNGIAILRKAEIILSSLFETGLINGDGFVWHP